MNFLKTLSKKLVWAKLSLVMVVVATSFGTALPARADNFAGKIDLVQVTPTSTRFLVRSQNLNLYASGTYKDMLLEGFYRRSSFSISYQPAKCPSGIKGTCGSVTALTVDTSNF